MMELPKDKILYSKNISWKEKGILLFLKENETKHITQQNIIDLSTDGRSSVCTGINNLKKIGVLKTEMIREDNGQFYQTCYTIGLTKL